MSETYKRDWTIVDENCSQYVCVINDFPDIIMIKTKFTQHLAQILENNEIRGRETNMQLYCCIYL